MLLGHQIYYFLVIRYKLRRQHHLPLMSQNLESLIFLMLCAYESFDYFLCVE